jgi:hypothetical protein
MVFLLVEMFGEDRRGRNGDEGMLLYEPTLSASSREKLRRSATTHAHAIMMGARFTTVNLCLSAFSSKISWKSKPPLSSNAVPSCSSYAAAGLGKYSFSNSRDDDDPRPLVGEVSPPCLRFFRGEDDADADADDEGGDEEGGSGGGEDDDDNGNSRARFFG